MKNSKPYLGFRIGSCPRQRAGVSQLSDFRTESMSEEDRERHALVRLVRGVAEHYALVPRSDVFLVSTNMHPTRDVRRLFIKNLSYLTSLVIKS